MKWEEEILGKETRTFSKKKDEIKTKFNIKKS
jgi:hypothetical protein